MNKKKKCPYCGKRISYFSSFFSRRKAEFICPRCHKESRVVINKFVILALVICALISVGVMAAWISLGLVGNPLGILLVAVPMIIFGVISPRFVNYEPFKKYEKSMEARKAGIEYSDNLTISDIDSTGSSPLSDSGGFRINSDVFNEIKAERAMVREQGEQENIVSSSDSMGGTNVYDIESVRENHAGSDAPLKKLGHHSSRSRHYIAEDETEEQPEPEAEEELPNGNRYSANRKF